jgi:hypothetical protein
VYNTYETWAEQVGYSARQVRRVVKELVEAKVLVLGNYNKWKSDRTQWYRVEYNELSKQMSEVAPLATCPLPTGHNVHMEPAKMSAPIPEMNQKMNAQVNSVVPDAFEKEQELSKKPTGEKETKLIMKADEILKNKAWNASKKVRLEGLWKQHVAEVYGMTYTQLGLKEAGQLRHFERRWGPDAAGALVYAIHNWSMFAADGKSSLGLETMPATPVVGYMLKCGGVLLDMYLQSIAPKPKVLVQKPKVQVQEVQTDDETYVPQPGDLEKALAMLEG